MKDGIDLESKKILVQLIAPLAPHLAEECWEFLGGPYSIFNQGWPKFNENFVIDNTVKIGVQINGKVRGEIEISLDCSHEEAINSAKSNPNVAKYLSEGEVLKEIFVPGKIVGFVVK
jgi:leucyl-tRNA synthetase